jgi:phosphoglycolate phosphatase/pyrophosphatase PpaX
MALRFRCLVLDHDDTAVDGTATIHYPAHLRAMELLRPGREPVDLEGWFRRNFDPGIMQFLTGELGMTGAELQAEYAIWREFATSRSPRFYDGFLEALVDFRARGGLVAVVSHSEADVVQRHYDAVGFRPDTIFGWDLGEERRKPSPWPIHELRRLHGLEAAEILVVDDLKPGVVMSQAAGVPVAAAGWAHRIPEIESFMRQSCIAYFETVSQFRQFVVG